MTNYQLKSVGEFENKEFVIHFNTQTDLVDLVQSNFTYDSRNLKCLFQFKVIIKLSMKKKYLSSINLFKLI